MSNFIEVNGYYVNLNHVAYIYKSDVWNGEEGSDLVIYFSFHTKRNDLELYYFEHHREMRDNDFQRILKAISKPVSTSGETHSGEAEKF